MSINWYRDKEFVIDSTVGEGAKLFGYAPSPAGVPPTTLRIKLNQEGLVTLVLLQGGGTRAFFPSARYIDGENFENMYPDFPSNDLIIGHFDFGDPNEQQFFLMWVRPDPKDPKTLRLAFFIFAHSSRFSTGVGSMTPLVGQQNGGGTGTGPA